MRAHVHSLPSTRRVLRRAPSGAAPGATAIALGLLLRAAGSAHPRQAGTTVTDPPCMAGAGGAGSRQHSTARRAQHAPRCGGSPAPRASRCGGGGGQAWERAAVSGPPWAGSWPLQAPPPLAGARRSMGRRCMCALSNKALTRRRTPPSRPRSLPCPPPGRQSARCSGSRTCAQQGVGPSRARHSGRRSARSGEGRGPPAAAARCAPSARGEAVKLMHVEGLLRALVDMHILVVGVRGRLLAVLQGGRGSRGAGNAGRACPAARLAHGKPAMTCLEVVGQIKCNRHVHGALLVVVLLLQHSDRFNRWAARAGCYRLAPPRQATARGTAGGAPWTALRGGRRPRRA